ncbi:MAG TPA: ribosomal protein S18-alanine N-acetyltransferase [Armatimonadota bacterium]|nr:ribosomal protein S18-alanine N-acetyltransferase [Armatimonadota bacterium]
MAAERAPERRIPIRIERMQLEDVETVAELDKKCFPSPWSASAYANEVHNLSAYYIVARTNSRIVGYGGMWLIIDEAHITTLGVDPEYRGRKIGERVLANLLDEAIHRGARRATLEVRKSNELAQNLYRKYGFRVAAIRRGYYTNNYEDAIVMWVDDMWDAAFLKTFRVRKEELGETA